MAKFLFCVPRYHTNFMPWTRILLSSGHKVCVHAVTCGPTENYTLLRPSFIKESPISIILKSFRKDHGINDYYAFPKISEYWSIMKRDDPDVVIIRDVTRYFSLVALIVALLQRRRVVIYDQEDPIPAARSTWIRRSGLRLFGIPHVTARLPVRPLVENFGQASLLPFGAPPGCEKTARIVNEAAPFKLLMVAKYHERKGHRVLLRALARLSPHIQFSLTFCGEEAGLADRQFVQSLSDLANELGLAEKVFFKNNVPHSRMSELYRDHDLFILPSILEPAAVSPIEAAWSGCAVLISRDSGTRGYIPPGAEFDFVPGDVEDITRAISSALQNSAQLQNLRNRCYTFISKVSNDAEIVNCFEKMLI